MILSSSGASGSMRGCISGCACARAPRTPPAAKPATAPAICSARRRVILLWSCMAIPPSQLRIVVPIRPPSLAADPLYSEPTAPLFDHLVGAGEQHWRDLQAERLGRPEIDYQLMLRRE